MSNATEEPNQDGDWGWEPLGSEDEEPEHARAITNTRQDSDGGDSEPKAPTQNKGSSEKVLSPRKGSHGSLSGSNSSKTMQGIVSSPSFLELEKAIGATLNLASNDSGELAEGRQLSPNTSFPASKLSSTNLTQQKVNQQRMRQQQHQQQNQRYSMQNQHNRNAGPYGSYGSLPQAMQMHLNMPLSPQQQQQSQPARVELSSFINESESRAIILFHSVHLSAVDIRNACSKYGVLYYIRPEFHSKGVTLISYFDLRAASSAKACIVEDLGRAAEASVHYSVMLHAANGNSEEFRLVVRNLPPDRCSEGEVQSIFARYGQLRSIQKTFEDGDAAGPSSAGEQKSSGGGGSGGAGTAAAADAETGHGDDSASSCSGEGKDNDNCKIAYSIEYYNIQDARLAASELSATSSQLWNADVTVKFAPLDDRKQQLCRQLLATLSRWRTEMASAMAYNMSLQQQQQQQLQQVHMQQQQARQLMGMNGMTMGNMGMMSPINMNMNMGGAMGYGMPQQQQMGMGMGMDMTAAMGMNLNMNSAQQFDPSFGAQQQHFQQQAMGGSNSGYDLNMLQQQQQQMGMAMAMSAAGGMMPMQQHQQRLMYGAGVTGSASSDVGAGAMGGGVPVVLRGPSPMHALMPANLSNPNLFNLGLLAAQAEAQMQQQQQALQHQHQQAVLNQQQLQQGQPQSQTQPSPSGSAGTGTGSEGGSFGADGNSPANAAQFGRSPQHQGFHAKPQDQQQQHQSGNNTNGRFNGNSGSNGPRHHHQNRGGNGGPQTSVPPHHNGGYAHNNGYGAPMQMQMPMQGFNGVPLTSHMQQQQPQYQQQQSQGGRRAGGKGQTGAGNGQQQQYGYSNANMNGSGGAGGGSGAGGQGGSRADTQIDADFALDLKRIGDDVETRTTIMVRNIPNKYNQQMLLEEVNVSHEGTYDFFYLPIDFKNRCNVGYCFINFLDPKHIPPFVNAFNGQRWKSFNSEKVCAVSFARIQGKQAMVARFQNSSLLEKDDEYQPLLFYSSGPDRGKPEPFPVSTAVRTRPSQQQHGSGGAPVSYAQHHLQQRSRSNTGTPPVPARSASHSPVPSHDAACDTQPSSAEERGGVDHSAASSAHTSISRDSQQQPVGSSTPSPSPAAAVALEQTA